MRFPALSLLPGQMPTQEAIRSALPSEVLASQATLCRLEHRMDRQAAVALHRVLVEQFIASHRKPPRKLILDFDATDDPVHGNQEGRFFHGYYDRYCFLPLYVFCGQQLLVSYLRPASQDGARHAWAILALLVKRLRQAWPKVKIVFRGDSGFCRHRMLDWCDRHEVGYVVGIAKNARLLEQVDIERAVAAECAEALGEKVRFFKSIQYAAGTWNKRVFDLVKDFGTSESPKSTRSSTTHWCPGRPGHPAFRHNIASSLRLHTGLPYDWTPRSDAPLGSPLAPSARRVSRVASRLPGTTRLRFALHGGQRGWRSQWLRPLMALYRPHDDIGQRQVGYRIR